MKKYIISAFMLAASVCAPVMAENIYLYNSGKVIFSENVENIGKVAYEDANTAIAFYDVKGELLFKSPLNKVDYLSNKHEAPVADLLDVEFKESGTATDRSPMKMRVRAVNKEGINAYYNKQFGRYAVSFDNTWGSSVRGAYRVDYASKSDFSDGLADGHTLEVVVMANYDGELTSDNNNREAKCFASHQSGGTGIMVCTKSRGSKGKNEFTFLPCTGGSYRWATSGTSPEKGNYYHIVGVWNKEEGKANLYVNGELVSSAAATGDYNPPSENSKWFCIGGDASDSAPSNGWKGDVVIARVYNDPLTAAQVKALWLDVEEPCSIENDKIVDDATFYSLPVKIGGYYPIRGKQYAAGDKFVFESQAGENSYELPCSVLENEARVKIPENFVTDKYTLYIVRGERKQLLGRISLTVVDQMPKAADIIAHRGYWNKAGSAQNSRASLRFAQDLDVYGSEVDVWLTADNKLYINHDAKYNGVTIETATSAQCAALKLSNGESMPTLEEMLDIIKESKSRTKLVIEIKGHSTVDRTRECATATTKAVLAAGLADKVEYISFSIDALDAVLKTDPNAFCAYLGSNRNPAQCFELGHKGIDFPYATYKSNKAYITQAHNLGMLINAWTFAAAPEVIEAIGLKIDFISTDEPAEGMYLREYYQANQ